MALDTKKLPRTGSKVDPIDAGTYPARVLQIIDLGLQKQRPFKGQEKDPAYEIMITYELLDEFMLDENGNELPDKPRVVSERMPIYSLEADRAKSTQRYFALDPENKNDGDFAGLINTPCMVTITQTQAKNGNVYNNVHSVSSMRDKDIKKAKKIVNSPFAFNQDTASVEEWDKLHDWIKNIIREGLEFEGSRLHQEIEKSSKKPVNKKEKEEDVIEYNEEVEENISENEEDW